MNATGRFPIKTFNEIYLAWQDIQTMDARVKVKALRRIGFDIINSYNKETSTLEEIDLYIKILRASGHIQAYPQNVRKMMAKLRADQLELSGTSAVKTITKISGNISVDTAMIMVGDPAVFIPPALDCSEKELLSLINAGKRFVFHTDSDGIFNVQLRIVEASEPVLTLKEYKFVEGSSQTAIINIHSGQVMVGDGYFAEDAAGLSLKVEPGNYKVAVMRFNIPNRLYSYYVVLCKTNETGDNNLEKIDSLE